MSEGLFVPDGSAPAAPVTVDAENAQAEFARLMSAQADTASGTPDSGPAAPPKREVDGKPRPSRGRPPKDSQARTRDAKPGDAKNGKGNGKPSLAPRDFTSDLTALGDGVWLGLSSISLAAPYVALVHANQTPIVAAINQGAQSNAGVRNAIEKLTSGSGSAWTLQIGVVCVGLVQQAWAIAKDPELRRQVTEANSAAVRAYMADLTGQMGSAAPEAA